MLSIVRHYRSRRTCLNVYDPDISYVYDTLALVASTVLYGDAIVIALGSERKGWSDLHAP
jgi:hypothetical protein